MFKYLNILKTKQQYFRYLNIPHFHQATVSLDCDQATMVTQHGKPMFTKVLLNILYVDFGF